MAKFGLTLLVEITGIQNRSEEQRNREKESV
jgi:hypothetical protein